MLAIRTDTVASRYRQAATFYLRITLPFIRNHRLQFGLLALSISLGVAAVVASQSLVTSAIGSVRSAFELSSSETELRISNGFAGVPEGLLEDVKSAEGVRDAYALILDQATLGDAPSLLVGIDMFGSNPYRIGQMLRDKEDFNVCSDTDFLVRPNAIAIPNAMAAQLKLRPCSTTRAFTRAGPSELYIGAVFDSERAGLSLGRRMILMDLPRAQILLNRTGSIDAIEVRLEDRSGLERLEGVLRDIAGPYATVNRSDSEPKEIRSLMFNIRLILGVAGSLAVIVGSLIIFNVVATVASKRKPEFDMMIALGATRRSLQAMVVAESLVVGVLSSLVGIGLGIGISHAASSLFQGAIAALYLPLQSTKLIVSFESIVLATACGILLTVAATISPFMTVSDLGSGLRASSAARSRSSRSSLFAACGAVSLLLGVALRAAQSRHLDAKILGSFVSLSACLVFLGVGLLLPVVIRLSRGLVLVATYRRGLRFLALSWRTLSADPTRNAVAIVSVMAGVSYFLMTIGTVGSLRQGVLSWLRTTQHADIVVSAKDGVGFLPSSPPISGDIELLLGEIPGIATVEVSRLVAQPFRDRWAVIVARDEISLVNPDRYDLQGGDIEANAVGLRAGTHAVISETLSTKHHVSPGQQIEVRTPAGIAQFSVAGVTVDYNSDLGSIILSRGKFEELWLDSAVTAYFVTTQAGDSVFQVVDEINSRIAAPFGVEAAPIDEVFSAAERVVDSAFYAGYALVFVAVLVVVASVLCFLTIAAIERHSEFEIMRDIGASPGDLAKLLRSEAFIIGAIGGLVGCITGVFIARSVVLDSIRIAGGMLLEFHLPWHSIAVSLVAAIAVSLVAAELPLGRIAKGVFGSSSRHGD